MAAAANLIVAVVYVGIAVLIVRPQARPGRLLVEVESTNPPQPGRFVRREPTRLHRP